MKIMAEVFKKLKKFFFAFALNKKLLALFVIFLIFASLVPLKFAQAGLVEKIINAILRVFTATTDLLLGIYGIVFALVQMITGIFPAAGAELLNAVVNLNTSFPLTPAHPGLDPDHVLKAGFQFTRGLANIAFILILAWIAFATILRIRSYQVKTILPKLLIIALLINFIPVIMGVIVDIANILTQYFADRSRGAAQWLWKMNPFAAIEWKDVTSPGVGVGLVTQAQIGIFFNIISFGLLLGYALVFFMRIAILWLLSVLAPLCWLGYLLPAGKRFWNLWWNQFILWSFVGIPLLFFLYLSGLILQKGMTVCTINLGQYGVLEGAITQTLAYALCNSYAPIVAIITLIAGAGISMTLMPKGAAGLVAQGKKAGTWLKKTTKAQTLGRLAASEKGKKVMEKAEKFGWGLDRVARLKEKGVLGKLGYGAATAVLAPVHGLRWATRYGAKQGLTYGAQQHQEVEKNIKDIEQEFGKDYNRAAATYKDIPFWNWGKKIAMGQYLAKTKGRKGLKKLDEKDLKEVLKLTNQYQPHRVEDLVKHMPEFIDDPDVGRMVKKNLVSDGYDDKDVKRLVQLGVGAAEAVRLAAFKKAVEALKDSDVENLADETLKDPGFQEAIVRFKPWSFIRKLVDERGLDYGEELQRRAEHIDVDNIAKSNATFVRAPYTQAGEMYLSPFAGVATKNDATARIKSALAAILSDADAATKINAQKATKPDPFT